MTTLRDLDLASFTTTARADPPVGAADEWVVLVDNGTPVSAIPPGEMLSPGERPPGIIVAPAALGLSAALESAAFAEAADVTALVVTENDGIAGVLAGPDLVLTMLQGTPRSVLGGSVMPGAPGIPWIARSCGFTEDGTTCATVSSFPSKPHPMPACRNEQGLTEHPFRW